MSSIKELRGHYKTNEKKIQELFQVLQFRDWQPEEKLEVEARQKTSQSITNQIKESLFIKQ